MNEHLSQISTTWTMCFQAHQGTEEGEVKEARRLLLQRYGAAVYGYLRAALKDPDATDEMYQEFALKLVRGDFKRAHPEMQSPALAEKLSEQMGQPVNAAWVRKRLHLARGKFIELLLSEIRETLDEPTEDELQEELLDLGLLDYCRRAFADGEQ